MFRSSEEFSAENCAHPWPEDVKGGIVMRYPVEGMDTPHDVVVRLRYNRLNEGGIQEEWAVMLHEQMAGGVAEELAIGLKNKPFINHLSHERALEALKGIVQTAMPALQEHAEKHGATTPDIGVWLVPKAPVPERKRTAKLWVTKRIYG